MSPEQSDYHAKRIVEAVHNAGQYAIEMVTRGNTPTPDHRKALSALTSTMIEMALGDRRGRFVVGAPTGFGKTSAITASLRAMSEAGLLVNSTGIMVCQSKVEALCDLQRGLIEAGIPADQIGLVHSYRHNPEWLNEGLSTNEASEEATPKDHAQKRPIVLVTHVRVRGTHKNIGDLATYGEKRRFVIYDESLVVADGIAIAAMDLRDGYGVLDKRGSTGSDEVAAAIAQYLAGATDEIEKAAAGIDSSKANHAFVQLPREAPEALAEWIHYLDQGDRTRTVLEPAATLLAVSQERLRVVRAREGPAIVTYELAVPEDLDSMLVLDASAGIRRLVQLDRTMRPAEEGLPQFRDTGLNPIELKRWDRVTVHHMAESGGREKITEHFRQADPKDRWISREVARVVNEGEPPFLIFTYLPRKQPNFEEDLKRDLAKIYQIDLNEMVEITSKPLPKLRWTRWGSHDSTNEFQDCRTVIMVGVMLRHKHELLGAAFGQLRNNAAEFSSERVTDLIQSDAAHLVYQGLSRAACRQVEGDQAKKTDVYVIHRDGNSLRTSLEAAMPGMKWQEWGSGREREESITLERLASQRLAVILYLHPADSISSRKLNELAQFGDEFSSATFSNAINLALDSLEGRWERVPGGRSLVRVGPRDPIDISQDAG